MLFVGVTAKLYGLGYISDKKGLHKKWSLYILNVEFQTYQREIASLLIERCMTDFVSGYYVQSQRFKFLRKLASKFFYITPENSNMTIDLFNDVSLYPISITRLPNTGLSFRQSRLVFQHILRQQFS